MPKQYKEARLMHKAKLTEMATKLGVSQPPYGAFFKKEIITSFSAPYYRRY